MAMRTNDVPVIGGGAAGSASGWGLARRGWRVALLDSGLKVTRISTGFDSILPGLAAHKHDLGASAFGGPRPSPQGGSSIAVKVGNHLA